MFGGCGGKQRVMVLGSGQRLWWRPSGTIGSHGGRRGQPPESAGCWGQANRPDSLARMLILGFP